MPTEKGKEKKKKKIKRETRENIYIYISKLRVGKVKQRPA